MAPHELSRAAARRIMVRAQLLTRPRPDDLLDVVHHLTLVQHDPVAAVAPSADLVLWSRLGAAYHPSMLRDALDGQLLIDHHGLIRPPGDIALYRAEMAAWPGRPPLKEWQEDNRDWVAANDGCRREILDLLRGDGPLPTSAFEDTCAVPWRSSGWNRDKNVQMLLLFMVSRGEVATAGRDGSAGSKGQKLWDLAERIYPDDPVPDLDDALRLRDERRLGALGIARAKATKMPGEPNDVGAAGEPAVVEGVRGQWRVHPAYLPGGTLDPEPFQGRAALLSPFDRLVADRTRLAELFEFDYQLEMYKPAAQRRWGYYALPILHGDRLVGKLDAKADRDDGVLRVHAVHEDEPFPAKVRDAVDVEIEALAAWLGLVLTRGQ